MMSGEAAHPLRDLKRAFRTIYFRFEVFLLAVPWPADNDPTLILLSRYALHLVTFM